jgi:hypothetical protein
MLFRRDPMGCGGIMVRLRGYGHSGDARRAGVICRRD